MNLLSFQTRVESPFIIVKIGNYTFGHCQKSEQGRFDKTIKVTYPNFMQSMNVVKVNGTVNNYTIRMVYAVTSGDDPNLLEKVFSSVSSDRKLTISYGDWESPSFIYREEEALITKVQSSVDFSGSRITYTISCVSDAYALQSSYFDFPAREAKPSDVIREILYKRNYGVLDIFYGMRDKTAVEQMGLILGDDKQVHIEAKSHVNILDYLNYLVSCMSASSNTTESPIKSSRYYLNIVDDTKGELGGPYFQIVKVGQSVAVAPFNTYEVDVGYPGNEYVTAFSLKDNEQWSILYDYAQKLNQPEYIYKIDDDGNMFADYSQSITSTTSLRKTSEAEKTWWTQVTQYPISASITIKGLMRPSILMSYVKVNVYFYGRKFIASGTYIITRQQDTIDGSGYRTELSLTRIAGE